jgi:tetratricopeptide (TPR) repeat protein
MNIAAELKRAIAFHQRGELLKAGEIYREILAVDPNQVDALNLMGVVMQAAGDLEMAEHLIKTASELAPDYFAPFVNLGNVLQAAGRLDEAIEAFRRAMKLDPKSVETLNNLASALNAVGNSAEALDAAERALKMLPAFPEALINKGNALLGLGRAEDAVESYRKALKLAPEHGNALYNLANAYMDLDAFAEAVEPYRKSVAQDPGNAEKQFNLANALMKCDRYAESFGHFERALALKPGYVDAHCNLASALQSVGRTGDAIAHLHKALAFQPDSPDLHWNLSLAALQDGNMELGWSEYEWRWKTPTFADFKRDLGKPEWRGEPLDGQTVLIHAEQGFGDALQFCRYASLVAAAGGRVVLECRPQLRRLFSTLAGVDELVDLGEAPPPFDLHIPLMSLPAIFTKSLGIIPADVPYLSAADTFVAMVPIAEASGFKVGLAWAGSPTRVDNHKRSVAFEQLEPLLSCEGATFFSLQVGPGREQLGESDRAADVVDLADGLKDFADTAAAVAALDLVISVDTSVLHLAGALGKPAFGLMSQPTGFLWMNERSDSPWYPTIRLFRQATPGDWQSVVSAAGEALAERVRG